MKEAWQSIVDAAATWQARSDTPDGWDVAHGSKLDRGDSHTTPLHLSHAARASIHSAIDHIHALTVLLLKAGTMHTFAGATLARSALEAACTVIWIMTPDDPTERVLRNLRWQARDLSDEVGALESMGLEHEGADDRRAAIRAIAEANGIAVDRALDPCHTLPAIRAAAEAMGADAEALHPESMWRLASGFAHARRWAVLSMSEREELPTDDPDVLSLRLTGSLDRLLVIVLPAYSAIDHAIKLYDELAAKPVPPAARKKSKTVNERMF